MDICLYNGREICTYDLKDEAGIYYQNIVLEWKRNAAKRKLICVDCGSPVYLAAGLKKEPYFAHYDIVSCAYGKRMESQELIRGKRLLYHMLKRSFPSKEIQIRHRLSNGLYTTCYVKNEEGYDLAIDYRLQMLPIKELDLRVQYFDEQEIIPVFLLGVRQDKQKGQLSWYQTYIQNLNGSCVFLDTEDETLLMKHHITYVEKGKRKSKVYQKKYNISEIKLEKDGTFDCDFYEECERRKIELEQKEEREQNRLREIRDRERRYHEEQRKKDRTHATEQEQKKQQNEQKFQEYQEWYKQNSLLKIDFHTIALPEGIRRDVLLNCVEMIKNGQEEMISKRYLNYINMLLEGN